MQDSIEFLIKVCFSVVGILAVIAFATLLYSFFVYAAWNEVMPVFGLPELSLWHSWCLAFLCSLLFKDTSIKKSD